MKISKLNVEIYDAYMSAIITRYVPVVNSFDYQISLDMGFDIRISRKGFNNWLGWRKIKDWQWNRMI